MYQRKEETEIQGQKEHKKINQQKHKSYCGTQQVPKYSRIIQWAEFTGLLDFFFSTKESANSIDQDTDYMWL